MAKAKRKATADALEILHRRYYAGKPQRIAALDQARAKDHVAALNQRVEIRLVPAERHLRSA